MKSTSRWLLMVLLTTLTAHASAAEGEKSRQDPLETGATDNSAAPSKPADPPSVDVPTAEVFVPTEEISEDFAVSFPVDI